MLTPSTFAKQKREESSHWGRAVLREKKEIRERSEWEEDCSQLAPLVPVIDLERVPFICALVRLTKIENAWFCTGSFSYAIQEKFTTWQVNSMLNFTWKADLRFVRYRFLAWNWTWNSLVTQWIVLYCIIISYCIAMIRRRNLRRN